jgi:Ca2+-binding RTX toxin-like protein
LGVAESFLFPLIDIRRDLLRVNQTQDQFTSGPGTSHNNHIGNAIDLQVDSGTPRQATYLATVVAAADGTVVDYWDGSVEAEFGAGDVRGPHGYGNYVTLEHTRSDGSHFYTSYMHLSNDAVAVRVGQSVSAGQVLGFVGNTGATIGATGPATHFHFQAGDRLYDPDDPAMEGHAFREHRIADGHVDAQIEWEFANASYTPVVSENISGYYSFFSSPFVPGYQPGTHLDDHLVGGNAGEWLVAGLGDDQVSGNGGNDTLVGGNGNDTLSGGLGDDEFRLGTGDDSVDGGSGVDSDTVVYNYSRPNYEVFVLGNLVLVDGPEGFDTLQDVEWLTFRDAGGPPYQSINVKPAQGRGDLRVVDLSSVGNKYDLGLGNVWLTNANSTSSVSTTTSAWGLGELVEGAGALWNKFKSLWTVNVAHADSGDVAVFTSGDRTIAIETTAQVLDFGKAGKLSLQDLIAGFAPDDHTNTQTSAVQIGSGVITSFTSASGEIESQGDKDVFAAQLQAGQRYSLMLWANATQGSRLDPKLVVRAPNGTVWQNDNLTNDTTMSFVTFVAPTTGTYYLEATGVGGSAGKFLLNITPTDVDPKAAGLTPTDGRTDPGNSSWHWQGTDDDDSFPTPGWDPNLGDLDAANRLRGHDGDDRIEAGNGNDIVWGDDDEDRLRGQDGNDTIRGGRHDDSIFGGDDDDLIFGEDGDDSIQGDTTTSTDNGDDTIYGGDGDDDINGGRDDDYIKGEDDNDDLDGDDGDDELYGDSGADEVDGDAGDDLVYGGNGNDSLGGGSGRDRLAGEDGDDDLDGDADDDALYGGDDNDTLRGGTGDDLLHGEDGIDTADFGDGNAGVVVNLFDEIAVSSDLGTDVLYSIENVIGSDGQDVIDGNHSRNELRGDSEDDIIRGHNGNDVVYGDGGDDVVWGDEGADSVYGGSGDDEVRGGLGADTLFGDSGEDHLRGEQGDDVIDGGSNVDTVFFWGEHDDFSIVQGTSGEIIVTDLRVDGLEGRDVLTNVEYLEFFDGIALISDLLSAAPFATSDTAELKSDRAGLVNLLDNDTLNSTDGRLLSVEVLAGGGAVSIVGGACIFDPGSDFHDLMVGESAVVEVGYSLITSGFQLASGTATLTIHGMARAGVLREGGGGNDALVGTDYRDTLTGLGGNDTLTGALGNDDLDGGTGTDTAIFTGATAAVVDLRLTVAQDTGHGLDTLLRIENVTSGSGRDRLTGNGLANVLNGGAGIDTLNGGSGNDTYVLGGDSDSVSDSAGSDTITSTSSRRLTSFAGIEHLTLVGSGKINAAGTSGANRLTGNGASNSMSGGGGNDTVKAGSGNDTVTGGAGSDNLEGGAGNDRFVFNAKIGPSNVDAISDFRHDQDKLALDDAIFQAIGTKLDAAEFYAKAGATKANDLSDRIIYDKATGRLYHDIDGNLTGGKAAVHFATLTNKPSSLDQGDFMIV